MVKQNIILIGMPGAGKSTLGVLLAKECAKGFVDTDVLIQVEQGKTLQEILDQQGYIALREIEEQVLLSHQFSNHVIATGGSAVYSEAGMQHLKTDGIAVFLHVGIDQLRRRISNYETRGIAKRPDQSFDELFIERQQLYLKYADIAVDCDNDSPAQLVIKILQKVEASNL